MTVVILVNSSNVEENTLNRIPVFTTTNYPNPFSAYTTINYTTKIPEKVEISIFDALGVLVKTLINKSLPV